MTRSKTSLGERYFEDIFQSDGDPWGLETSPYEAAKFDRTIATLDGRRYDRALEIGCAGGALTERLAPLCSTLLAIDISATAVARARRRCAGLGRVSVEQMGFPGARPAQTGFDLIVLSEVAYYWDNADLARAADAIRCLWARGGDLLLVHWTGETDYPQTADTATDGLKAALASETTVLLADRTEEYRLDLWRRR